MHIPIFLLLSTLPLMAGEPEQAPSLPPLDLVRRAVDHAVSARQQANDLWAYRLKRVTDSGSLEREMLETPEGILARTLAWNGRELTPTERALDDARLSQLLTSKDERKKKFKEQKDDEERLLRLVRALPEALVYESDGAETVHGRNAIRLKFKPNPGYSPASRESYLFKAAEGRLWIDEQDQRIVRLDGKLMDDVNVGFGFLAHLDQGGTLLLEQDRVGEGAWRISTLRIDVSGRAFLFKKLRIRNYQVGTEFQSVKPMKLEEAVDFLKSGKYEAKSAK